MTERTEHERCRLMLGAYVLGGLDPADRAAVDAHAAECAECAGELARFAVVPGLLAKAIGPEGTGPDAQPAEALASEAVPSEAGRSSEAAPSGAVPSEALRGAMRSLSAARRRRRVRITTAAAAGTLAAGLAIGFTTIVGETTSEAPVQRTVTLAAEAGPFQGSADLAARPWGTELRLDLRGLPAGQRLEVVAVGADGRSEPAGTWSVPDGGKTRLTGATSMSPGSVRGIEIRNGDGTVLARSAR